MKKLIIVCLVLSLFLCGCESKDNKSNDNQLANDIKENIENLLKVNSGSSSNPYDYIHTEYYNDIVNLGEDAIPVLIKMYKDGEFSKDGLDSYIISIAIQEIANCSLYNKYQLSYANPSEFFDLWEKYNCGFYPYGIDSDVSLEVMEKTITDKGATFVLKNNTSNDYWYGPEYVIEKKENGKWYTVDTIDGEPLVWNTIAYKLSANDEIELNIDWSFGYSTLKSGTYRLVKSAIKDDTSDDKPDNVYLYAQFIIK